MFKKSLSVVLLSLLLSLLTIPSIGATSMNLSEGAKMIKSEVQVKYDSWDEFIQAGSSVLAGNILDHNELNQVDFNVQYELDYAKRIGNTKAFLATYILVEDN